MVEKRGNTRQEKKILNSDFELNKYGDTLIVDCKADDINYVSDILIFGNTENALISNPRKGQSISRYNMLFVKDNSPSIGFNNDTLGIYGTLSGYVIDMHSDPVCNREFALMYTYKWETDFIEYIYDEFETNNDGFYSMRVLSKSTNYESLMGEDIGYLDFVAISYVMEPDSSVIRNVILLEDLKSGIPEPILDYPIKIFPNPITIWQNIKIEINLPVLTSDINIELIDLSGKLIRYMHVKEKNSEIETPKLEGVYILKVLLGTKQIKSFKIIVKNE